MHERLMKTTIERGIPAYRVCSRLLEHARCVFKSVVLEEKNKTERQQQQKHGYNSQYNVYIVWFHWDQSGCVFF